MIGLVLVTHGRLADEFVTAMVHVVGPQERVATIAIGPDDDMEERRADIATAIAAVDAGPKPVVFMLWGNHAQKKAALIHDVTHGGRHLVLTAAHPSPLSAYNGFFGSRHFSKANAFLETQGRGAIDWAVPDMAGWAGWSGS